MTIVTKLACAVLATLLAATGAVSAASLDSDHMDDLLRDLEVGDHRDIEDLQDDLDDFADDAFDRGLFDDGFGRRGFHGFDDGLFEDDLFDDALFGLGGSAFGRGVGVGHDAFGFDHGFGGLGGFGLFGSSSFGGFGGSSFGRGVHLDADDALLALALS